MQLKGRLVLVLGVLGVVSACASPQVAKPVDASDRAGDCAALAEGVKEAEALRVAAREEDKFQWKYVFVVNGFISAYRINEAEEAAEKRSRELQMVAKDKGCMRPATTNAPVAVTE